MPRISSTSCIIGTGFMKWMPMKRSGRSVTEASRVIEIEEVLVARMALFLSAGQRSMKILRLTASSSVAASITRSASPSAATSVAPRMRFRAVCISESVMMPRET